MTRDNWDEIGETAPAPAIPRSRPSAPGREAIGKWLAAAQGWLDWRNADLLLLVGLLFLTEAFGRVFTRIGSEEHSLFISEPLLLATIALAVVRLGADRAWRLLRSRVPLIPLLVFWFAAAVAVLRGLEGFGLSQTIDDIGIVEYSVLVPIAVLVADDRRRLDFLQRALVLGGLAALVVFAATDLGIRALGAAGQLVTLQPAASGMYMSFFVVWVAASLAHGLRTRWYLVAFALAAMVMTTLTDQRSVWLTVIASLAVVAVLAPRGRRLGTGALVAAAVVVTGVAAVGIDRAFPQPEGLGQGLGASQIEREIAGITDAPGAEGVDPGVNTGPASNVRWRLAYWEELIARTGEQPLFGAGLGRPTAFTWEGKRYDLRTAERPDPTGPHNGFVDILYRTGVIGFAAMIALIGIALWRVIPLLPTGRIPVERRAELVTLLGILASAAVIAFYNDALRNPFEGIFFWAPIGLLLAWAALERGSRSREED